LCDQQRTFDLGCNGARFVDEKTADSLPANIGRYNNVVDLNGVGRDLHRQDRDDVSDELPEQSACRDVGGPALRLEKNAHRVMVRRLDCANEKALSFHRRIVVMWNYLMLLQHS
jgi:hypothetical protein